MTNEELAHKILETFDHADVARQMRATDCDLRDVTSSWVKHRTREMILQLLREPPETHSMECEGFIVLRNGSRIGIGYVPVHSEQFP